MSTPPMSVLEAMTIASRNLKVIRLFVDAAGQMKCQRCGFRFTGATYQELLDKLYSHGRRAHPEIVDEVVPCQR